MLEEVFSHGAQCQRQTDSPSHSLARLERGKFVGGFEFATG